MENTNTPYGYVENGFGRTTYSGPILCSDCYDHLRPSQMCWLKAVLLYRYHECSQCGATIGGSTSASQQPIQPVSQPRQVTRHQNSETVPSSLSVSTRTLLDHAMSTSGTVPEVAGQSLATSTLLALMAREAGDDSRLHGYLHHIHSVPVAAR